MLHEVTAVTMESVDIHPWLPAIDTNDFKFSISDIDECTMGTDDCVDGATCVNTVDGFTCTCPPGFSGDGRASPDGSGCTG